jgi:pimeloyl-ACP methyl ester carboxylesterase
MHGKLILVLLPGMDGTGVLFQPLLASLPTAILTRIIAYPSDRDLSYAELFALVNEQLPKEPFILLAESFSGPIAASIIDTRSSLLCGVIFVSSFIGNPRPLLKYLHSWLPLEHLIAMPLPTLLLRLFCLGIKADDELIALFTAKPRLSPARPAALANPSQLGLPKPEPLSALMVVRPKRPRRPVNRSRIWAGMPCRLSMT